MKNSYNHAFPPPTSLVMNSFALDISDQSIKYGELIFDKNGLSIGRYGQVAVPEGAIVSGKIEDSQTLIEVLKDLKKKEKLNFIRVALPEEQMYLFTTMLPSMEHHDIYDSILLQLEEHVPIKAQDSVFAYNIVSQDNNGILVEVSVAAITTVDSYLSVFEQADLVPLSFELEAQAIARSVVSYSDLSTCMIVDFGKARTGVSIVCSGKVFFTTTVDFGGNELTEKIASSFGVSFDEAESMKKSYGINSKNPNDKIFESIVSGLGELKDNLNKHILYWQTHNISGANHDPISKIILCGGDANIKGLAAYLESQLKIKVISANAWVNISDFSTSVPSMPFEQSLLYSTVLGLALGDHLSGNTRIVNVLPVDKKKDIKVSYWLRFGTVFLYSLSFLFLFGSTLLIPSYINSFFREKEVEIALENFNKTHKDVDLNAMSKVITDVNSKISVLSKQNSTVTFVKDIVSPLLDERPSNITYNSISYVFKDKDNLFLEVSGDANDRTSLSNFKEKIENNPNFYNVEIPISDFLERKDLSFNMSLAFKKHE